MLTLLRTPPPEPVPWMPQDWIVLSGCLPWIMCLAALQGFYAPRPPRSRPRLVWVNPQP